MPRQAQDPSLLFVQDFVVDQALICYLKEANVAFFGANSNAVDSFVIVNAPTWPRSDGKLFASAEGIEIML